MARKIDKQKAIELRKKGMSYSQIKNQLGISKSTLSNWLNRFPLSAEEIVLLRDKNPQRIERSRNTKLLKKEAKQNIILEKVKKDIGNISERELFLMGLMLYWGEGTKAQPAMVALTNTNPAMLQFFIRWMDLLGVEKSKLKVRLHLYSDMNVKATIQYWANTLGLSIDQFKKPYVKKTSSDMITYKRAFKTGTCSVTYGSAPLYKYIMMGIKVFE